MTNWYPAKAVKGGPQGFTNDPEFAETARVGDQDLPILCRGGVMALVQKTNTASLNIWEKLLDAMEQNYELLEEYNKTARYDADHKRRLEIINEMKGNAGLRAGLIVSLAYLTYGSDDENAIKLIQAQAKVRYEKSSE